MIGERLKHAFGGNDAWILSYREECFDQIGLKPSIKIPVFNGSLECEFRKYAMFEGKMKEFRAEGGIVKTEEEKKEMAQKHRFKKNREFKQRLDDEEENEAGDIRSFKFHSFEKNYRGELREKKERRPRNEEGFNKDGKRFDKGDRKFDRGSRNFDKEDKRNNRKGNRFDKNSKRNNSEFEKRKRRFSDDE